MLPWVQFLFPLNLYKDFEKVSKKTSQFITFYKKNDTTHPFLFLVPFFVSNQVFSYNGTFFGITFVPQEAEICGMICSIPISSNSQPESKRLSKFFFTIKIYSESVNILNVSNITKLSTMSFFKKGAERIITLSRERVRAINSTWRLYSSSTPIF